jgi:hypothetical protein
MMPQNVKVTYRSSAPIGLASIFRSVQPSEGEVAPTFQRLGSTLNI